MYFDTKSYLKSTRNHTAKHALKDSQVHQNQHLYWTIGPKYLTRALRFEPFYWFVSNRTPVTLLSGAESLKENKKEKGKQLTQN
jgi:hypothetical protein